MILFEPYRVTLFGHRYIDHFCEIEDNLERVLDKLSFSTRMRILILKVMGILLE